MSNCFIPPDKEETVEKSNLEIAQVINQATQLK